MGHLLMSVCEPCFNRFLCFSTSTSQSISQSGYGWWAYENKIGIVREDLVELECSLKVYIENWYLLGVSDGLNLVKSCPIEVPMDLEPLNESIFFQFCLEFLFSNEKVMLTVNLSFSRGSCCARHAEAKVILFVLHKTV